MESLVAYLVAAMIGWVPLHVHAPTESVDDARDRYESIARDVVSVAFDESESPLFSGPEGRTQTALLMLSVASYESGYREKVDDGRRLGDHCALVLPDAGSRRHRRDARRMERA